VGDYPLPPSGGPAFLAGGEGLSIPLADLLPARESSLVLVPTLSSIAAPGSRNEALVALVKPSLAQPERGAGSQVLGLNAFLDLSAPVNPLPKKEGQQTLADSGLSGASVEQTDDRSDPEPVSPVLPSSIRADERAGENEAGEPPGARRWTHLRHLLVVAGLPVLWACWLRHRRKASTQPSQHR
jgi:hypothetical protein